MKKKIIALAAPMGAGKSFFCERLLKSHIAETIKYSKILSNVLEDLDLENNRQNLQNLSLSFRNLFGENILEKYVLKKIKNSEKDLIILDGVRRAEDFDLIEKQYDFNLIFIDVDLEKRQARFLQRNERLGDEDSLQIQKTEGHNSETRHELKEVAKFLIENNGTLEEFEQKIDQTLSKIL